MHCSFQATDKLISWPLTVAKLIHHVPIMIFYGYYLVGIGTVEMRMLDILAAAVIHDVRSKLILNSNVAKYLWLFSSRIALYVYTVLYTNLKTDLTTEWSSRITQYLSLRWVSGRYRKLFYRSTAVAYEARTQGKKLGQNQCIKQTKQNENTQETKCMVERQDVTMTVINRRIGINASYYVFVNCIRFHNKTQVL